MKDKALGYLRSRNLNVLLRVTSFSALILDLLNSVYFFKYWEKQALSQRLWSMALMLRGESWGHLDPAFQLELLGITDITLSLIIMAVVMVNSVFYLYLLFAKKWAYQYVISYTFSAAALCILTLFEGFPVGGLWEAINIFSIPSYLGLSLIIWSRKTELSQSGFRLSSKV
ncbi:MAG: hypothetical protein K2P81_02765 [Bacteriovoracaceae bacterium]|nr:hypothetical protein [Bacteriovoracaceae bacterium]